MTLTTTTNVAVHEGNDVATGFAFSFHVISEDHLIVTRRVQATGLIDKTYIINTEYSVTGIGTDAGTVTLVDPLASGYDIIITRTVPYTQELDIVNQGGFFPETVEEQLDLLAMQTQQVAGKIDRAVLAADGEAGLVVPSAASLIGVAKVVGTDPGTGVLALLDGADFSGDPGGNIMSIGLWSQLVALTIPAETDIIHTSGYDTVGEGAALYVSDATANLALATAHPRACKVDVAGRYWRLLPVNNEITAAQLGALGSDLESSTTDERVALQAGFDYAIATGAALILPKPYYTYNQEARTAADTDIYADRSGVGMVVEGGHLVVKSGCGFTRVRRRAPAGGDPAVWANWPLLSGGAGWRGGLVFLVGTVAAPAEFSDRAGLTLDGVLFDGGIPRGASYGALNTGTGDGWDVTDKGLWGEGDRYKGDVYLLNGAGFIGCRGEVTYYQGGDKNDRKFVIRRGILGDTNGSALNIEGASLDIDGLFIYKCSKWSESWGGPNGRVVNTVVYDCINDGFVQAGIPGLGAMPPSIGYPTRYVADAYGPLGDGRLPTLDLQITFIKGGTAVISPWTNIDIVAKDTGVDIGNNTQLLDASYGLPWKQISGRLTLVTDTMNNVSNLTILGGQTAGKVNTDEISLDVKVQRTESAATAGYNYPRIYHERSLGPNIRINLDAPNGSSPPTTTLGLTDYMPIYSGTFWDNVMQVLTSQNVETTPALTPTSPIMGLTGTTAGWHNFSVITTAGKIQKGQRIRVLNSIGGAHTFLIRPSGDGLVASDHQVLPLNEFMDLRFQGNHGGWEVLKAPNRYKAAAAPAAGTWAVGAIVENNAPAAAGFAEWRCVTAGTPGTWKTANPISA